MKILKKITVLFLAVLTLFTCTAPIFADDIQKAKDIDFSKWYASYVAIASIYGYLEPTSQGKIRPNDTAKREEIVYGIWVMCGSKEPSDKAWKETTFTDIGDLDKKHQKAIIWAKEAGITAGVSNNEFGTHKPVTREQVACFIHNVYTKCRVGNTPATVNVGKEKDTLLKPFPDANTISPWALSGVLWAIKNKVISGQNNNGELYIAPKKNMTRAELATILIVQKGLKTGAFSQQYVYDYYFDYAQDKTAYRNAMQSVTKSGAAKMLSEVEKQYTTYGGKNFSTAAPFYMSKAWCCHFVYYCANRCGLVGSNKCFGASTDTCSTAWGFFKDKGQTHTGTSYVPKPGDLIFFTNSKGNVSGMQHVGIVIYVSGSKVYTIEGNQYEGGRSGILARYTYDNYVVGSKGYMNGIYILGYATPNYPT